MVRGGDRASHITFSKSNNSRRETRAKHLENSPRGIARFHGVIAPAERHDCRTSTCRASPFRAEGECNSGSHVTTARAMCCTTSSLALFFVSKQQSARRFPRRLQKRVVTRFTSQCADAAMPARREQPRSPRSASSPRRFDSRLASVAATAVPAPLLSTARSVLESFGADAGHQGIGTIAFDNSGNRSGPENASGGGVGRVTEPGAAESATRDDETVDAGQTHEPEQPTSTSFLGTQFLRIPGESTSPVDFISIEHNIAITTPGDRELDIVVDKNVTGVTDLTLETGECRICLSDENDGAMCAPCKCDGSMRVVHWKCLERWCQETGALTCELCLGEFPKRFVDAGSGYRRNAQAQADSAAVEQREANERLQRLLNNFQQAYGRPANCPADFAVINLNAVLEAEAFARRRRRQRMMESSATTETGETATNTTSDADDNSPDSDAGARVVVIDAHGRAVTLNTRHVGAGGLARMMLEGEAALDDFDSVNTMENGGFREDRRGAVRNAQGRRLFGGRAGRFHQHGTDRHARLRAHIARVYVGEQFRFWLKAALAALCFFLALYLVLFAVAASTTGGGTPVFIFRVVGFALPLLLIARVAYLYRRHRERQLIGQLDEVFVLRDVERGRNVGLGNGNGNGNADADATVGETTDVRSEAPANPGSITNANGAGRHLLVV